MGFGQCNLYWFNFFIICYLLTKLLIRSQATLVVYWWFIRNQLIRIICLNFLLWQSCTFYFVICVSLCPNKPPHKESFVWQLNYFGRAVGNVFDSLKNQPISHLIWICTMPIELFSFVLFIKVLIRSCLIWELDYTGLFLIH